MENSTGEYKIEKLTKKYIPAIADFFSQLAVFVKDNTNDEYFNFDSLSTAGIEEDLRSSLSNDDCITYIAISNNEPIGFISGTIIDCFLPISKVNEIGYISGAFVAPSYRNMGIMKKLEDHAINFFREKNLKYIELNVISRNNIGKSCWNNLGYTTFREQLRKKI